MDTNKDKVPFVYNVVTASIANNANTQQVLIFDTSSFFEWHMTLGTTNATNETTAISPNNFSVSITDQGTGRNMTSARIPQSIMMGNAFNNGRYPIGPILIMPGSNFSFDILNTSGNSAIITIALHGFKLFNFVG